MSGRDGSNPAAGVDDFRVSFLQGRHSYGRPGLLETTRNELPHLYLYAPTYLADLQLLMRPPFRRDTHRGKLST
jgi:hypothetical protein